MKTRAPVGLVLILTLVAACSEAEPTAVLPVLEGPAHGIVANGGQSGTAHLSGESEIPSRETRARGQAVVRLSDDGTEVSYQLIVANIENVVQAHFHLGPADENGPVVAFLFGPVPGGAGGVNGPIAEGTITADDLVGPLAGAPMASLVEAILAGGVYVNVHTNDGVAPTNTGPGDFPGGEVRGQVR